MPKASHALRWDWLVCVMAHPCYSRNQTVVWITAGQLDPAAPPKQMRMSFSITICECSSVHHSALAPASALQCTAAALVCSTYGWWSQSQQSTAAFNMLHVKQARV